MYTLLKYIHTHILCKQLLQDNRVYKRTYTYILYTYTIYLTNTYIKVSLNTVTQNQSNKSKFRIYWTCSELNSFLFQFTNINAANWWFHTFASVSVSTSVSVCLVPLTTFSLICSAGCLSTSSSRGRQQSKENIVSSLPNASPSSNVIGNCLKDIDLKCNHS